MTLSKIVGLTTVAITLTVGSLAAEGTQFVEAITVQGVGGGAVKGGKNDYYLTFSAPVALPGVALPAGTYIFRRPAPDILQVLRADGPTPIAMMTTQTIQRTSPIHQHQVVLRRAAVEGAPWQIQAWFAAREQMGQQLIYAGR